MSEPEGTHARRADGIPPEALPDGVTERQIEVLEAMQVPTQRIIAIGLVLWLVAPRAQVRSPYGEGAAGLIQKLERLTTTASALHTGAHPDDEDSALLARLATRSLPGIARVARKPSTPSMSYGGR